MVYPRGVGDARFREISFSVNPPHRLPGSFAAVLTDPSKIRRPQAPCRRRPQTAMWEMPNDQQRYGAQCANPNLLIPRAFIHHSTTVSVNGAGKPSPTPRREYQPQRLAGGDQRHPGGGDTFTVASNAGARVTIATPWRAPSAKPREFLPTVPPASTAQSVR